MKSKTGSIRSLIQTKTSGCRNGARKSKAFIHPKSRCVKQLVKKANHQEKIRASKQRRKILLQSAQISENAESEEQSGSEEESIAQEHTESNIPEEIYANEGLKNTMEEDPSVVTDEDDII